MTRYDAHLCETRKVDQREVEHVRAVYAKVDGQLRDTLVLPSDPERLGLNLLANFAKVCKALVEMEELAVFGECRRLDALSDGRVYKLQDERSARNNSLSSRQEVPADNAVKRQG